MEILAYKSASAPTLARSLRWRFLFCQRRKPGGKPESRHQALKRGACMYQGALSALLKNRVVEGVVAAAPI